MVESDVLLSARGISKSFGSNRVLNGIDLEVRDHEVLGVVGENGAGKSTLLNILSGVLRPDGGSISMRGEEVTFKSYRDANAHGVFRVFQELALVPSAAVYENLFLTHERRFSNFGVINRSAMVKKARQYLEEFEHGWIDPTRPTGGYPFSTRQILEIIKVFALAELLETPKPVLLLDEPTAGLLSDETEFFFRIVEKAKEKTGIVYVGHRLGELLDHSDGVLVFKDGEIVAHGKSDAFTEDELHAAMVGRQRGEHLYHEERQAVAVGDAPVLRVENLSQDGVFRDIDLQVNPGEIVGIAGVIGSGKSELARAVFGAGNTMSGTVEVNSATIGSVSDATRAGVGYVPQDRASEGALLPHSVAWNISLARLQRGSGKAFRGLLDLDRERSQAKQYVEELRVKTPDIDTPMLRLSGGNQQKVILARWIAAGATVLVLDNPTRGVDVGAKENIYSSLRELVASGVGILLVSDDLVELIMMSDRIHVMNGGNITATIETPPLAKPTEFELVSKMV